MFGNRTKSYSLKVFGKFDYQTDNYENIFSLLHPRRFLPRLSGEYTVLMEIYEGRNATGVISLLAVAIKKQTNGIHRTKSNKIEQIEGLSSIKFGNRTH